MTTKTAKHGSVKTWVLIVASLAMSSGTVAGPRTTLSPTITAAPQADTVSWEAMAGYYRFPNRAAYIRFFDQEDEFVAQQVWDGRTYPLHRTGSLTFQSSDEAYEIAFMEGKAGVIDKAKILGRIILEKVSYNPTRYIKPTAEQLKPLLGLYQFQKDKNMEISLSIQGGKLALRQQWDNQTILFEAYSPTDFFNEELTFPLTFDIENGAVKKLTCFESDVWLKKEAK
ncbi:hypothetical protein [Parapedobacter defluvii]|nr:hypothetical protein [Parapedobacter defluvii]